MKMERKLFKACLVVIVLITSALLLMHPSVLGVNDATAMIQDKQRVGGRGDPTPTPTPKPTPRTRIQRSQPSRYPARRSRSDSSSQPSDPPPTSTANTSMRATEQYDS